ncbi:MAG: LAGLIDADG family homing endonuclease [Candidatus Korarchaeota archaeon]|nr:LAGLIDADG family homing endonuclease [Candidatus Korarchaeota archaeon]
MSTERSGGVRQTPGGRRIPHDLRVELYLFVRSLHDRGNSYREIQRIVEGRYGVRISRSNISYWVRGLHSPLNEPYNHLDTSRERDLAWIAGMLAGDGSIKVNRKGRFLALKVRDRELAEEAARRLAVVMGRVRPYAVNRLGDGRYYVQVQSRELVDHLGSREGVLAYLERRPREFIRAFFDCEGCCYGSISRLGYFKCGITVANTDRGLLERIRLKLEELGIASSRVLRLYAEGRVIRTSKGEARARKTCYYFEIRGLENLKAFQKEIGFVSKRKRRKLADVIDILGRSRDSVVAAVEWIRRYEYRVGLGRERWFPRELPLSLEEAWEEYERHTE